MQETQLKEDENEINIPDEIISPQIKIDPGKIVHRTANEFEFDSLKHYSPFLKQSIVIEKE